MYNFVLRIKEIALAVIKVVLLLWSWVRYPFYAAKNGMVLRLIGVTPVISVPFEGVFNGQEETLRSFTALADLFDENEIEYFVVPKSNGQYALAIMSGHRERAIEIIDKSFQFKGYYFQITKYKFNTKLTRLLDLGLPTKGVNNISAISIYRNIGARKSRIIFGETYNASVEFWSRAEDLTPELRRRAMAESGVLEESVLAGSIVAPVYNGVAKVFSAVDQRVSTIKINDKQYPTLEIFKEKLLGKVEFPIDVVYTWVDGSDPRWLEKYTTARKEIEPDFKNNSMARYSDHEELKYSLRSLEMYAPWIRNIFIVTDNQKPHWLRSGADRRIKFVNHKDIFSDSAALPVFNSHAIESQLHHISGLSEHYLYVNDDIIFANPTTPETFFYPNGIAKVQPSSATVGTGSPTQHESAPSSAGKNARNIIRNTFGIYAANKYRHTVLPQIKTVALEIEDKNASVIQNTMFSKFRSPTDVPFASNLMQGYLLASGCGVAQPFPAITVDVSKSSSSYTLKTLLKPHTFVTICLNETITDTTEEDKVHIRVKKFLNEFLPYPSTWEVKDD